MMINRAWAAAGKVYFDPKQRILPGDPGPDRILTNN
jgi:hypothetical protein